MTQFGSHILHTVNIQYINPSNCELVDADEKKIEEYYVKKTQLKHKKVIYWHFTASINEDFNEEEQQDWILGKSSCKGGFIDLVEVSTSKVRPPSVSIPSSLNARRCGIGTILSVLCMIDKDVNPGSGIALDLKSHFKLNRPSGFPDTEMIKKIEKNCKKVVGLEMSAAPGAGNIYFQAASLAGFNRMIFYDRYEKNEWIWPHISDAQACYNSNKLGCKNEYYSGIANKWYFCKEKETTDDPVQSCFSCFSPCRLKFKC